MAGIQSISWYPKVEQEEVMNGFLILVSRITTADVKFVCWKPTQEEAEDFARTQRDQYDNVFVVACPWACLLKQS